MVAATAASFISIFYIPKKSYRLALVSFLLAQVISWPIPLILVQIGYVEFPVRDFVRAARAVFSIHYIIAPMVFAWFILLFPQNASALRKIIHCSIFVSILVWFIHYISYYTDLQEYLKGTPPLLNALFLYTRNFAYFIVCYFIIKWFSIKTNVLAGGLNA